MKRLITENNKDIPFIQKINRTIFSDDINTISLEIPYINNYVIKEEVIFKKLMIKNEEEYKITPNPHLHSQPQYKFINLFVLINS